MGKISLIYFDGSSNFIVISWVQKVDTRFQLNPMGEKEDIKMVALHLDGEANEWWFHGMKTLGHDHVTTYEELTKRLI